MNPTCGLRAAPRPITVFLTTAGEYSAIATPRLRAGQEDHAAGMAEHQRGAHVPAVKRFLDCQDIGLVTNEEVGQRRMDLMQPLRAARFAR